MKVTEIMLTRRSVLLGMGTGAAIIASIESNPHQAAAASRTKTAAVPARKKVPVGLL